MNCNAGQEAVSWMNPGLVPSAPAEGIIVGGSPLDFQFAPPQKQTTLAK